MPRRQGVRARTAFYNCCANICPQDADRRDGFDSRIDQCVRQGLTFCRYRTEPSQGLGPTKPARVEQVPAKRYRQPACTDAYVPTNHPRDSLPPSRVPKFARTASSECRFCLQLNAGFAGLQPALTRTCTGSLRGLVHPLTLRTAICTAGVHDVQLPFIHGAKYRLFRQESNSATASYLYISSLAKRTP